MSEENLNEKVDIDGRTRVYRETALRLEQSRKLREQRNKAMQENKFGGLYDDGSGKGAIIPAPVDINFHEAMKNVEKYKALREKYKALREKKKVLMGAPKKEQADTSVEAAVVMKGDKYSMSEEELSPKQKEYRKFFNSALKRFDAKSPASLDDTKKKKFFDYVKANWKG